MTELLGSGHKYFDISQPRNNRDLFNLAGLSIAGQDYEYLLSQSNFVLGQMFTLLAEKEDAQTANGFLEKVLSSTSPELQRYALTQRSHNHPQLHFFKNNRDNILMYMASIGLRKLTPKDRVLLKKLVLASVEAGLNPLEKSAREGESAMALLFGNSGADLEIFDLFHSLSPLSLVDMSEDGETAMSLMARANRAENYFVWLANKLPQSSLEENMLSIKGKIKSSSRANKAYTLMQERLIVVERNTLELNINILPNSNSSTPLKI